MKKMIALYYRLSKRVANSEDPEEESNSIRNQRGILQEYVKHNFDISEYEVKEFIDDGFTGTSMDRPAMKRLLSLVQEDRVYMILVKDFSRFARNYIAMGTYIENIFPSLGVRFISVNDRFDSFQMKNGVPELEVEFKGILHDYYCKELSKKSRQSRRQQVEKGKYIAAKPIYGYWKSSEEKGLLVIDPDSAPVVRQIFEMYLDGNSAYRIAKDLNLAEIPTPNQRLINAGMLRMNPNKTGQKKLVWTFHTVMDILKNQIYVGDLVGNKMEKLGVGKYPVKRKKKEEWTIVCHTHEPIIDLKMFVAVQNKINESAGNRAAEDKNETRARNPNHIFCGMLICGKCGASMVKYGEGKNAVYYTCSKCAISNGEAPHVNSEFLKNKVLEGIHLHKKKKSIGKENAQINEKAVYTNAEKVYINGKTVYISEKNGMVNKEKNQVDKEKKAKTEEDAIELADCLAELYMQYAEGMISREEYLEKREKIKKKELETSINTGKKEEKEVCKSEEKITEKATGESNREVLKSYIDNIIVYKYDKIKINWLDEK